MRPTIQGRFGLAGLLSVLGFSAIVRHAFREAAMFLWNLHGGLLQLLPGGGVYVLPRTDPDSEEPSTRPVSLSEPPIAGRGVGHACFGSRRRDWLGSYPDACPFDHFLLARFCMEEGPGGWRSEPMEL